MLGERQSLPPASWAAAVASDGPGGGLRSTIVPQAGLDAAQGWRALVFCCDLKRCTEA
jgi:hypothetical protein